MPLSKEAVEAKPKQPQNVYFLFRNEKIAELKDDPAKKDKIKQLWENMDPDLKKQMEEEYQQKRIQHKDDVEAWRNKYNITDDELKEAREEKAEIKKSKRKNRDTSDEEDRRPIKTKGTKETKEEKKKSQLEEKKRAEEREREDERRKEEEEKAKARNASKTLEKGKSKKEETKVDKKKAK